MIIINKKIDIMKWMKKRQLRRNKNNFRRLSLTFIALVIVLSGTIFFLSWSKAQHSHAKSDNGTSLSTTADVKESTSSTSNSNKQVIYPTIYIAGSSGSVTPVDWLVQRLLPIENVPAHKSLAITADVNKDNLLKIEGQISQDNQYPMIEFGTVKGTDSGSIYSSGLQKVVSYLMQNYQIPWINLVGYSSGGTGAVYYMIDTANNPNFPPVNKYVSLDGEYNKATNLQYGESLTNVLQNGPLIKTQMYQYIEENYERISPKVQMLLLEGDFNSAKQTDSAIPWADSFSIYHLFKNNGNEITSTLYPTKASHSQAPKNPTVVKYVKNFLYGTP